jgi:cell shape-determining protein MreD
MNTLRTIFILMTALIAVFSEAAFSWIRNLLGAQVDLLPALMVYAGLHGSLASVTLLAVVGGLGFDSLSANPLGVTALPLFLIGLALHVKREVIVREQAFAQFVLGASASLIGPVLTLLLLLSTGHSPLLGWGTLWQLLVMSVGGGVATPLIFEFFNWLDRTLVYGRLVEVNFRGDREIRRGR